MASEYQNTLASASGESTAQSVLNCQDANTKIADETTTKAKKDAQKLVSDAKSEAERLLADAKSDAERVTTDAETKVSELTAKRDQVQETLRNLSGLVSGALGGALGQQSDDK